MKQRIRLTESQLNRVIKESVRSILKESGTTKLNESQWSGGEYNEDDDEMYIGRTSVYHAYDNWIYSQNPNDDEFTSGVYALNADGINALNMWILYRKMSQQNNAFNPNMGREEMWEYLTNPKNGLSTPLD